MMVLFRGWLQAVMALMSMDAQSRRKGLLRPKDDDDGGGSQQVESVYEVSVMPADWRGGKGEWGPRHASKVEDLRPGK
jgi:hypothetical protein